VIQPEHIYFDALEFSPDTLAVPSPASPPATPIAAPTAPDYPMHLEQDLGSAKEQAEWQLIQAALQETDSKKEAAERLGISPRTLRHKLQKLKASEPDAVQSVGAS